MEKSRKLFTEAQNFIPGGVNSPVRAFSSVGAEPPLMERGEGSKIYDVDGKEYIDCVMSWGPLILGHGRKEIVDAVKASAEKGTSFGASTENEVTLAKLITELIPSVEKVRLVSSGTEATMSAVRLARGYTNREKIIKFEGCYHGHADSFLIKGGSGALTLGHPSSPGVTKGTAADTLCAIYNNLDSVKTLFDENKDEIAALIVEPMAGNMGVVPPAEGFLQGLRDLCTEHGAVLIFDEVITGFRLSNGGAQKFYSIMPDLTTLGKIIGGGLPVGAFGGKKEIMDHLAPIGPVYQAGTLSGNPITVAAGIAALSILKDDNVYEQLESKGNRLFNSLKEIIKEKDLPCTINHIGSGGTIFFKQGFVNSFADVMECDTDKFSQFHQFMLDKGIYLAPSQFEAAFVSLAHSDDDIDTIIDAFKEFSQQML